MQIHILFQINLVNIGHTVNMCSTDKTHRFSAYQIPLRLGILFLGLLAEMVFKGTAEGGPARAADGISAQTIQPRSHGARGDSGERM